MLILLVLMLLTLVIVVVCSASLPAKMCTVSHLGGGCSKPAVLLSQVCFCVCVNLPFTDAVAYRSKPF